MLTPEEQKRMLLEELEQLTQILATDGMAQKGSRGQPVAHWALRARHSVIDTLRRLDKASPTEEPSALDEFLDR